MRKKLSGIGNGWALFLTKTLLELMNIDPETDEVELEMDGKTLKVKKAEKEK